MEETVQRERLAREQLQAELAIAHRIQTALLPKKLAVPGLDIAAGMLPPTKSAATITTPSRARTVAGSRSVT